MNEALAPIAAELTRISDNAAFEARLLTRKAWESLTDHPEAEFVANGVVTTQPGLVFDENISRKTAIIVVGGVLYETKLTQSIAGGLLRPRPDLAAKKLMTNPENLLRYSRMSIRALTAHADKLAQAAGTTR